MSLPSHLFVSETGELYDTRISQWHCNPLRADYSKHFREISNVAQFKATLRAGTYAWPGGYPLGLYCNDGEALCFKCARENARTIMDSIQNRHNDGWRVIGCDSVYEEYQEHCAHCGHAF